VFKHGLDGKDDTIDLMLDRDLQNQLHAIPGRAEILTRMATHYQPNHSPAVAKSTGAKILFASLPTYTINFARMTIAEINTWVAKEPVGILLIPGQSHWDQRAILHIWGYRRID
jgi:hypothetical protein